MSTQNLLVELFVEELPPKALKKLGEAFATLLVDDLRARGIVAADAAVAAFASPRRLALPIQRRTPNDLVPTPPRWISSARRSRSD